MSDSDKLLSLARLATNEGTTEHERNVAARELAKRVARGELPAARVYVGIDPGADLFRKVAAMEAILAQNATELQGLRADKAELEDRVKVRDDEIESLRTTAQSKQLETTTAELKRIAGEWKKSLDQVAELNAYIGGSIDRVLDGGSHITSVRVEHCGGEEITGSAAHFYGRTEGPGLRLTVEILTADHRLLHELQRRTRR